MRTTHVCQFNATVASGSQGNVRPFDLGKVILESGGIENSGIFLDITREGLYTFCDGNYACPSMQVHSDKVRYSPHRGLI